MNKYTDTVEVRRAAKQDLDALCRLYFDFHEFHVRGVPDRLISLGDWDSYDSAELRKSLERIMADDQTRLLVAAQDDVILGLAEAYLKEDTPNPVRVGHRYTHLQSLIVCADQRKQGIGRLLVQAVEQWAREQAAEEDQARHLGVRGGTAALL